MCLSKNILLFITFVTLTAAIEHVIIDIDAGVDDYHALVLLLNADNNKKIKIEAIQLTNGNTILKNVELNVMRLLEIAGRTDIPVYKGHFYFTVPRNQTSDNFFGKDGFGDLKYKKEPNLHAIKSEFGSGALLKLIQSHPKKFTILAIGPLTNIAELLRIYESVSGNVKQYYIMGGNYGVRKLEFNFRMDPESAYTVFNLSRTPIYLATYQACIRMPLEWRQNVSLSNPVWNLVNAAEENLFNKNPRSYWGCCDCLAASAFLHPEIITQRSKHLIRVEIDNPEERGLVYVVDSESSDWNADIFESYDTAFFENIFMDAYSNICSSNEKKCISEREYL